MTTGKEITDLAKAKKDVMESAAIVQPAVSTQEALKQFKAFLEIKEKCLSDNDKLPIAGNPYIRKTGWRKIKTIFNLSEEILSSQRVIVDTSDGRKKVMWAYRVRVSARNGAFADAEMSCDTEEDFAWANKAKTKRKPETMIMAMAQTRAFNRAISDLVGGGEVSAEEMMGIEKEVAAEKANQGKTEIIVPKEPKCHKCDKVISEKVYKFSLERYQTALCFKHQKELEKELEGKAEDPEKETNNVH